MITTIKPLGEDLTQCGNGRTAKSNKAAGKNAVGGSKSALDALPPKSGGAEPPLLQPARMNTSSSALATTGSKSTLTRAAGAAGRAAGTVAGIARSPQARAIASRAAADTRIVASAVRSAATSPQARAMARNAGTAARRGVDAARGFGNRAAQVARDRIAARRNR